MRQVEIEVVGRRMRGAYPGERVRVPSSQARILVELGRAKYPEAREAAGPTVSTVDLEGKTKAELEELASGLEVEGTGKDGSVLKADLVRALAGRYGRRDMRAES